MFRSLMNAVHCADYVQPNLATHPSLGYEKHRDETEEFFLNEICTLAASVKKIEDRFSSDPKAGTMIFNIRILAETPSDAKSVPKCQVFNIWRFGQQQFPSLSDVERNSPAAITARMHLAQQKPATEACTKYPSQVVSEEGKADQARELQDNKAAVSRVISIPSTSSPQPQTEHVVPVLDSDVQAFPRSSEDRRKAEAQQKQEQDETMLDLNEEVHTKNQAEQQQKGEHNHEAPHPHGDGAAPDSGEEQKKEISKEPQQGNGVLSHSNKEARNEETKLQEDDGILRHLNAGQHNRKSKLRVPDCPDTTKPSIGFPLQPSPEDFAVTLRVAGDAESSQPRFAANNDAIVPSASMSILYKIPDTVAEKCLRLLLQGSGAMKHRKWPSQIVGYAQIRNEDMTLVLNKFLDHRRAANGRKGTYKDLLPKQFLGKDVQVSRILSLGPRNNYNVVYSDPMNTGELTEDFKYWTKLNMFVILCGVLMFPSSSDLAEEYIMTRYAEEGMGTEGCVRASRFCGRSGCPEIGAAQRDEIVPVEKQPSASDRKRCLPCDLVPIRKRGKRASK